MRFYFHARFVAAVVILGCASFPAGVHADESCSFDRGTTTCVTTTQSTETEMRRLVSGCLYGPLAVPGRRERIFEDRYLVTVTTTTLQHGKEGKVYETRTETSRSLLGSQLVADTCVPV